MAARSVCVVGCNGFVGSHVTAELLSRGISVRGAMRDLTPERTGWLEEKVAPLAVDGAVLDLVETDVFDAGSLAAAMRACDGVICSAGSPVSQPETIDLMVALAENVCDAALAEGVPVAVFTSSTGSTNPPEGEPALKNEIDHWSDADLQYEQKKYAAVGKTRLDRIVLERMAASGGRLRCALINPSLIAGPSFRGAPATSTRMIAAILTGDRMSDRVPNGSMSMVDVRDLAKLHVAALENPEASGRYFGVRESWHWRQILAELERLMPGYAAPQADPDEVPVTPTQFDLNRQRTLGVTLRDNAETLKCMVGEARRHGLL